MPVLFLVTKLLLRSGRVYVTHMQRHLKFNADHHYFSNLVLPGNGEGNISYFRFTFPIRRDPLLELFMFESSHLHAVLNMAAKKLLISVGSKTEFVLSANLNLL